MDAYQDNILASLQLAPVVHSLAAVLQENIPILFHYQACIIAQLFQPVNYRSGNLPCVLVLTQPTIGAALSRCFHTMAVIN